MLLIGWCPPSQGPELGRVALRKSDGCRNCAVSRMGFSWQVHFLYSVEREFLAFKRCWLKGISGIGFLDFEGRRVFIASASHPSVVFLALDAL